MEGTQLVASPWDRGKRWPSEGALTDGEASIDEGKKIDPISTPHPFYSHQNGAPRNKVMLYSGPLLPWAFILRGPLVFFLRPRGERTHTSHRPTLQSPTELP